MNSLFERAKARIVEQRRRRLEERVAQLTGEPTGRLLLNVTDTAHLLELSRQTVYELAAAGVIPSIKIGTAVRIPLEGLRLWIRENSKGWPDDLPWLLDTPARWRFLSLEPLLGPLAAELRDGLICRGCRGDRGISALVPHYEDEPYTEWRREWLNCPTCAGTGHTGGLHWVITGGESGRGFRPMDPQWALDVLLVCRRMDIPYFHKQGNGLKSGQDVALDGQVYHEFPADWAAYLGKGHHAAA